MPRLSQIHFRPQRLLALLMVAAVAFLALAVYSPLHKHDANGRCSLNSFEHVMQGETEAAPPNLALCQLEWKNAPGSVALAGVVGDATPYLRGPPPAC
ncbi:MAG: hypothetical protein U5J83_12465 [Bryobacterales bacterium]|nr:hypothetical protein [Bryobacterales bacterium]